MLPILASLVLAQAAAAPVNDGYTRFVTKPDGTLEMSTAAQRLTAPGKPDVWLVGAIHVGSRAYYTSLQGLLDAQGAVFFEGVRRGAAPPAKAVAPVKPVAKPAAPPVATYKILSDALGLDFQLLDIDYAHPNWINVDLTMDDLDRLNKASAKGKPSGFDQVKSILDPNSPGIKQFSAMMGIATPGVKEALKIFLVRTAGSAGGPGGLGFDPATEAIIVQARNRVVIDALNDASFSTRAPKSIGVFYGAYHMPSLQSELVSKYGYRLGEKRWFAAADADPKKLDPMGKSMLDSMDKMIAARKAPAPAKP